MPINPSLMRGMIPCVSLWQTWASLIAWEEKCFETRGWATDYRGPLLIHAAKKWDRENMTDALKPAFRHVIAANTGLDGELPPTTWLEAVHAVLPFGALVCLVDVVDCVRTGSKACTASVRAHGGKYEWEFGGYADGRYAWRLENVRVLTQPIPYRGAQQFFNVPAALVDGQTGIRMPAARGRDAVVQHSLF